MSNATAGLPVEMTVWAIVNQEGHYDSGRRHFLTRHNDLKNMPAMIHKLRITGFSQTKRTEIMLAQQLTAQKVWCSLKQR
jgi:hypothetical protein